MKKQLRHPIATGDDVLVLECSPKLAETLDALVASGCFGANRDAAAQRLLERGAFVVIAEYNRKATTTGGE